MPNLFESGNRMFYSANYLLIVRGSLMVVLVISTLAIPAWIYSADSPGAAITSLVVFVLGATLTVTAISWEVFDWAKSKAVEIGTREAARDDPRRFLLVLHSFQNLDLVEGNWQWRYIGSEVMSEDIVVADSILNRLEEAVGSDRAMICIGSDFPSGKSLVFNSRSEWFRIFEILLPRSEAVILFPAESDGLIREIDFITSHGYWNKMLAFMTPETLWSLDSFYHHRATGWKRARQALCQPA